MDQRQVAADPYSWPYNGDLRAANTALVVIDMQTDFCGIGGYVDRMGYDLSLTRAPIAPIAAVLAAMRRLGFHVFFTREGHRPDLADLPENKRWRSQRIVFNDIALDTALAEYNRYTRTPIVLSDPALGSRHINGVFHIGDEAAFLSAMEQGLHLKATRATTQTVLEPEAGYTP